MPGQRQKQEGDNIEIFYEWKPLFIPRYQQGEMEIEGDNKNQEDVVNPAYLNGKFFICYDREDRLVNVEKTTYEAYE